MAIANAPVTAGRTSGAWRHALAVVAGITALFIWIFAQPLATGRLLSESDLFDQYLPLFRAPSLVWSSFEFGGVPAFADPENSAFYPLRWIFGRLLGSWNGFIIAAYVLAGCFTYAYLYFHTRSRAAATVGAVGFALSEAMLERLPHANILHAVAWVPAILLSIDEIVAGNRWPLWVAAAGFAGANCVLAGHPQLAVYAAYLCGGYAAVALIAERAAPGQWLRVATAGMLAVLLASVSLIPLFEISRYSVRQSFGFAEFVEYANTPAQMLSLLFPLITHSGLESPTYVGLVVLVLAAVAVTRWRSNWRIVFWTAVAAAGLMLGAGAATPLASIVHELPFYDRFRIVSRHLIFAAFALNALCAFGVASVLRRQVPARSVVAVSAASIGVIAGAALLVNRFSGAFHYDALPAAALTGWPGGEVLVQLALMVLALAALATLYWRPRPRLAGLTLTVLLAADLAHASSYEVTARGLAVVTIDPAAVHPSVHARRLASGLGSAHQRFVSYPDSLRDEVVPGLFARTWGVPSVGGYTSLLLKDVADLVRISPNGHVNAEAFSAADSSLDLLAVRYATVRADRPVPPGLAAPRWRQIERFATSTTSDRREDDDVRGETGYLTFENERALPRVWLTSEVLPTTDGVMLDAIRTSRFRDGRPFDPRATALIFEGDGAAARYDRTGEARVTGLTDSRVVVDVMSPQGGYLVLSEIYYPGWRARIDRDPPQPVHRTDLALQGVTVPAGRHVVTFEFSSDTRHAGLALGGLGVVLLAAATIAGLNVSHQ
jgi:hypothetical protein